MKRFKHPLSIYLCLLLSALIGTAVAQSAYPQADDPYVNDYARAISFVDEAALRTLLSDFEEQTAVEAAVLTIDSIHDYPTGDATIESFATNLLNDWGIGDAVRNDGVLVLVAVDDRQVRLEVGSSYGREFDAALQRVIENEMLPRFREERYSLGIYEGTRATTEILSGGTFQPPDRTFWQSAVQVGQSLVGYWWAFALGALALFGVVRPLGPRTVENVRFRIPRRCPGCGRIMNRIELDVVHNHFSDAQQMEVKLGSVAYSGWKCFDCSRVTLYPRILHPIKYTVCPNCNHRTVSKYINVKPANPRKKGVKRDVFTCHNCEYFREETAEFTYGGGYTAKHSDSATGTVSDYNSDNSHTSSGSGGNDSFGGGSSSGGGASGSW